MLHKLKMNVFFALMIFLILISQNIFAQNSSNLFLFKDSENGKYGYMDETGKIIIAPKFDYASNFSDNLAAVIYNKVIRGYVDRQGNIVLKCNYRNFGDFINGVARISLAKGTDENKITYMDKDGKILTPKVFSFGYDFSENYALVLKRGIIAPIINLNLKKWSYINTECEFATDMEFDSAKSFYNGFACVENNEKWGIIDKEFNIVINFQYDDIGSYSCGLIRAKKNGKYGYIDINGNTIIDFQYDNALDFSENYASVYKEGLWSIIDITGETIVETQYSYIGIYSEGLVSFKSDGKWGFLDEDGEVAIMPMYDYVDVCRNGLIFVDNSYYINRDNEIINPHN